MKKIYVFFVLLMLICAFSMNKQQLPSKSDIIHKITNAYRSLKTFHEKGTMEYSSISENGVKDIFFWGNHELFMNNTSKKVRFNYTFNTRFQEDENVYSILSTNMNKGFEEFLSNGNKTNKSQKDMLIDINRSTFAVFFIYPKLNKFYRHLLEDTTHFELQEEKLNGVHCYKISRQFHYSITKEDFEMMQSINEKQNKEIDSLGYPQEWKTTLKTENKYYKEDTYWFRKSDYMLIKAYELSKERTDKGLIRNIIEHNFEPVKNPVISTSTFEQ